MPFNGSGVFSRLNNWTSDANNNLPISATKFDNEDNDFATGFNNCLTRDGQGVPTAALTWAFPITLNRGSDGTELTVARTGGTNNPQLAISLTDSGGAVTLNASGVTAQLKLAVQGTSAISINATAAVSIAAASSGKSLTVDGLNDSQVALNNSAGTQFTSIYWQNSGTTKAEAYWDNSNTTFRIGASAASTTTSLVSGGDTIRMSLGPNGNMTLNTASSGTTFTCNGQIAISGSTAANNAEIDITNTDSSGKHWRIGDGIATSNGNLAIFDSTSSVLRVAVVSGNLQATDDGNTLQTVGWRDIPQNLQSVSYQLVLADRGKQIYTTTSAITVTIPANGTTAFPVGSTVQVINDSSGNITIAITTDTLAWLQGGATSTGSRTIATGSAVTLEKVTSTRWIITGNGIS